MDSSTRKEISSIRNYYNIIVFNYINNNFNEHRVMKFETDGANEYKYKEVVDCGIYRINSLPYIHEMNGKARKS